MGFIDNEFRLNNNNIKVDNICAVTDTLDIARKKYPGQRISLDALCSKLNVDASARTSHGALLDAEILAEVFLAMTGGQGEFEFNSASSLRTSGSGHVDRGSILGDRKIPVILPSVEEEGDDIIYQMKLKRIEIPTVKGKMSDADCIIALRSNFFGDEKYMKYQEAKEEILINELDKRSSLYDVYKRVQQAKVNRAKK